MSITDKIWAPTEVTSVAVELFGLTGLKEKGSKASHHQCRNKCLWPQKAFLPKCCRIKNGSAQH